MESLGVEDLKAGDVLLFKKSPYLLYTLYKYLNKSRYENCAIVINYKYGNIWTIEMGGVYQYSDYHNIHYIKEIYGDFDIARNKNFVFKSEKIFKKAYNIILGKKFAFSLYFNLFINKLIKRFINKNHIFKKFFNTNDEWTGPSLVGYVISFWSNINIREYYEFMDADYFINNKDWEIYSLKK